MALSNEQPTLFRHRLLQTVCVFGLIVCTAAYATNLRTALWGSVPYSTALSFLGPLAILLATRPHLRMSFPLRCGGKMGRDSCWFRRMVSK
jgi:hypothetical protein